MNEEYKPITNLWKDFEGYRYFGTLKLSSKIKYDGDDFIPLWEWVKLLQEELEEYKNPIKYFKYANKNVTDENKKLKEKYENAVADYETTMSELQELKKQLEDANEKIILLQASEPMLNYKKALEENQQKEFIEYLENMLDNENDIFSVVRVKDILQKYKEIIKISEEK